MYLAGELFTDGLPLNKSRCMGFVSSQSDEKRLSGAACRKIKTAQCQSKSEIWSAFQTTVSLQATTLDGSKNVFQ